MEQLEGVDSAAKSKILMQIDLYYRYFPELAEFQGKKKIFTGKTSLEELQGEIERCKTVLNSRESLQNVKTFDLLLFRGIESLGVHIFKFPLWGLSQNCLDTQDTVDQELKEISIKYNQFFSSAVEFRYAIKVMTRIKQVYDINCHVGNMYNRKDDVSEAYVPSKQTMDNINKKEKFKNL